jgi:hypothetical protein
MAQARLALLVVSLFGVPGFARAQHAAPATGADCPYESCALGIAPRWNGLAIVRGASGPRVANLSFFWPHDVTAVLRGPNAGVAGAESAAREARRAVRLRRIGAALTDGGILLGAVALLRASRAGRVEGGDATIAAAGGAALALSVPFQFAADGALSRAVWWHNLRFAR